MRSVLKNISRFALVLLAVLASGTQAVDGSCIQFTVSQGTGCAWMCNYCANQLGTNNYYFTDGVCTYQESQGCVGNPIAGKTYTCCSASEVDHDEL